MAFRKGHSRHSVWARLVAAVARDAAATGVPASEMASEARFIDLLTCGQSYDGRHDLRAMSDEQFLALERVAAVLHQDSQDALVAFSGERLRRFGRYG